MENVPVYVLEITGRTTYYMQWVCPKTGKKKTKTTGIPMTGKPRDRKAAEGLALELSKQLAAGNVVTPSRLTWAAFRERYESEVASGLANGTQKKIAAVCNAVEKEFSTNLRLVDIDAARLSTLVALMRKSGKTESTIDSNLRHLKAMLNWAKNCGWLVTCPTIPKVQRKKKSGGTTPMKGRPITVEELERMLACTAAVVGTKDSPAWRFYIRGLWASGLRLEESLNLHWDQEGYLLPVFDGQHLMLQIPGELEKGHTDRLLPMSPEFACLMSAIPERMRTGVVFPLPCTRTGNAVGKIVSSIGRKAGVVVRSDQAGAGKKFASAHDLRRSFGDRWASRIMPADLQKLMRHESIETTLRYYVGREASKTSEILWAAAEAAGPGAFTVPDIASAGVSQTVSKRNRKTASL